jgi:tripartite-type tricarboxylate transporter receptor subunit TctC
MHEKHTGSERFMHRIFCCLSFLALLITDAGAQGYYAGKQLTVLVNYDAGGPTDIEARIFARHIGRHIAGVPNIIVQNMGGAAGLIGTKYLGEVAPKDGTILAILQRPPSATSPIQNVSMSISAPTSSSPPSPAGASISCAPTSSPA